MNKPINLPIKFFQNRNLPYMKIFAGVLFTTPSMGLNLSNSPLFISTAMEPNILMILDDSGSMHWELMPDELIGYGTYFVYPRSNNAYGSTDYQNYVATVDDDEPFNAVARSPQLNKIYYNPAITYKPWSKADGTSWSDADPKQAYHNPSNPNAGFRDLTIYNTEYADSWDSCSSWPSGAVCTYTSGSKTFWPATYFQYNSGDIWNWNSYTKIEIKPSKSTYTGEGRENRTDCVDQAKAICTYAEEIQNFANWYSYYRSRILTARAGIGRAFGAQGPYLRVGFGAINQPSNSIDGVNTATLIKGVRRFSGSDRNDFFTQLYEHPIPTSSTPLRRALDDAGQYYSRTDSKGPWSTSPGTSGGTDLACRQSYTILMTDGYWNSDEASTSGARNNNDGTDGTTITGPNGQAYTYSAVSPFSDNRANTLADVAMYYWKRDLRTDIANKVATTTLNPAFWQHMVTFGIGLGVSGSIDSKDAFDAISTGNTIIWNDPTSSESAKLDDLLHAAVNSRGGFFSANDPDQFATSLNDILQNISQRSGSAAAAATNSTSLLSNSKVYQARFDSGDWTGQLLSFNIDTSGTINPLPNWDASCILTGGSCPTNNITYPGITWKNRVILTWNGNQGTKFRWKKLTTSQQNALRTNPQTDILEGESKGLQRLQYIRGRNIAGFRTRTSKLGDIVHSAPFYVGPPKAGFIDSGYNTFANTLLNRDPIIYVGANDGMLHGFDAATGEEKIAYIPGPVYKNLNRLTDPLYGDASLSHRYYADGSPMVADAEIGSDWKTVLAGGLNGGGQGYYALDITNPANFSESNAADLVLWEFTDEDDPDLGYTYNQPPLNFLTYQSAQIAKMNNGKWALIVGNGYNSSENDGHKGSGHAVLFILFLEGGIDGTWTIDSDYIKIDTGSGSTATPNGLATPMPVDVDYDGDIDLVYAGDLKGNLWKFDLTNSDTKKWTKGKLFTAKLGGDVQPITTAPMVFFHPDGGYMVSFGTGKYLEQSDLTNTKPQTLYGIWDNQSDGSVSAFSGRSQLVQQTVLTVKTISGTDYRITSNNEVDYANGKRGWYMDLPTSGERVAYNPIARDQRSVFVTLIPSSDECKPGGDGWIMELNYLNGSRLSEPPFDITGDNKIDNNDKIAFDDDNDNSTPNIDVPPSGKKLDGIPTTPAVIDKDKTSEVKIISQSTGALGTLLESKPTGRNGRLSWRQIFGN